jgi:hypothetical protein
MTRSLLSNTSYHHLWQHDSISLAAINFADAMARLDAALPTGTLFDAMRKVPSLGTPPAPGTTMSMHTHQFLMNLKELNLSLTVDHRINAPTAMISLIHSLSQHNRYRPILDAFDREVANADKTLNTLVSFLLSHEHLVGPADAAHAIQTPDAVAGSSDDDNDLEAIIAAVKRSKVTKSTKSAASDGKTASSKKQQQVVLTINPSDLKLVDGTLKAYISNSETVNPSRSQRSNTDTPQSSATITTYKYCWTHGIQVTHSSDQCRRRAAGHNNDATMDERKGGSNKFTNAKK